MEASSSPGLDTVESKQQSAGPSCGACGENAAKYTCPACSAQSCSLDCCKRHKTESGCTGKRSRNSLVSLTEFNDRELISDYRFLEEVGRAGEAAFRGRPEGTGTAPPERVRSLLKAAGLRHVDLRLQMPGMSKRQANTSRYDHKRRRLTWCLGWHFPAADVHILDREVDEHAKAADLLQAHLSLNLATLRKGLGERAAALEPYRTAGVDKLQIVMKAAFCQVNHPVYHHISGSATLSSQLAQKAIIEYPELTVVLPNETEAYGLQETVATPQTSPLSVIPNANVQAQPSVLQEPLVITA